MILLAAATALVAACSPAAPQGQPAEDVAAVREWQRQDLNWELARKGAAAMDERLLAAQVIMAGVDGAGRLSAASALQLREIPVGSVMLFKYNLTGGTRAIRSLTAQIVAAVAGGGGPEPFVAADHEGGSVQRLEGTASRLPAPGTFAPLADRILGRAEPVSDAVYGSAYRSARELRALGINLNLAPVAEVLDERNRPFLGDRSYGADPRFVARAAADFVRGMGDAGVACAVKHFPGNAAGDPHTGAVRLSGDRKSLDAAAEPFREVFRSADPTAVMVSHAVVDALDPGKPGSLSEAVMTIWLKGELGCTAIVLADDFSMGAVASSGLDPAEAAAEAIAAGADLVMAWPRDLRSVHGAILAALASGRLDRSRLEDAAARILYRKAVFGLFPGAGEFNLLTEDTAAYLEEQGVK